MRAIPDADSPDARLYRQRCSSCHALPHPGRIDYSEWTERVVVLGKSQMPVVSLDEKTSVLDYIVASHKSGSPPRMPRAYKKRCAACHAAPDPRTLEAEEWSQRIRVLDGAMPVFSSAERDAVLRYFRRYGRGGSAAQDGDASKQPSSPLDLRMPISSKPAPLFTLPSVVGTEVSLRDYRGKLVLLHFWATWCKSCREELPSLAALGSWLGERDFAVIAIAIDRKPQAVRKFVSDIDDAATFLIDSSGDVRSSYLVGALPTTYLVGKDGKFLGRMEGPRDWSRPNSRQELIDLGQR